MKLLLLTLAISLASFTWSLWASTFRTEHANSQSNYFETEKAPSSPENSLIDFPGFVELRDRP